MKFTMSALSIVLLAMAGQLLLPATEARFASINVNLAMTVSEDSHHLSEDMVRICAQETDLSMDELRKFRQNDFTNSSEATQCFTHCIYEQMGLVRDGVFVDRDVLRTLADVTDPNKLISKECMDIRGANKCETAFKIHQCHHDHRMRSLPHDQQQQQQREGKHHSSAAAPTSPMNANENNNVKGGMGHGMNKNMNNNNNMNNMNNNNGYDQADMDD